jgi:hypothetical protein
MSTIEGTDTKQSDPDCTEDYWNDLITSEVASDVIGVTERGLEAWRARGGGPEFVRVSSRCIRYRRIDIKRWADDRLRRSTSDMGAPQTVRVQAIAEVPEGPPVEMRSPSVSKTHCR